MRRPNPVGAWSASVLLVLMAACANPVPPTGGPTDQMPPEIIAADPPDLAVNVDATELRLTFSEHVDQATLEQAISFTPAFSEVPEIAWSRRTAVVQFPEPLRPNTTYLVQIDNTLRDLHGVTLRQPIVMAFATGPRINRGRIVGRVVSAHAGRPVAGADVFAYADPQLDSDTLPERPDYRTQTGQDGNFSFEYLPEGASFFVAAVSDANQNRVADQGEAFAAPPVPGLDADTLRTEAPPHPWVLGRLDTIPPTVQRARMPGSRQVEVRFSEPVHLAEVPVAWTIRSEGGATWETALPFESASDERDLLARTDSIPAGAYELAVRGVVDTSGNPVTDTPVPLSVESRSGTSTLQFRSFGPDTSLADGVTTLSPGQFPSVIFSMRPDTAQLRNLISARSNSNPMVPFDLFSGDGITWHLSPPSLAPGDTLVVSVTSPEPSADTVYTHRFIRLGPDELGEISGAASAAEASPIVIEVYGPGRDEPYRAEVEATGSFLVRNLPAGRYFVRAFVDADRSGDWSPGQLAPYVRPEPVTWHADSVRVRARWETALDDTLRFLPPGLSQEEP